MASRGRAADYSSTAEPGRHTMAGFPHLNSNNGACLCTSACCHGKNGCICRRCSGVNHENCPAGQVRVATEQRAEREGTMQALADEGMVKDFGSKTTDFTPGMRVELHPTAYLWTHGCHFGTVVSVSRVKVTVKFDTEPDTPQPIRSRLIRQVTP